MVTHLKGYTEYSRVIRDILKVSIFFIGDNLFCHFAVYNKK